MSSLTDPVYVITGPPEAVSWAAGLIGAALPDVERAGLRAAADSLRQALDYLAGAGEFVEREDAEGLAEVTR